MYILAELKALNNEFELAEARVNLLSREKLEHERQLCVVKRLLQQNERDLKASKWTLRDKLLVPLEVEVLEQRQEVSECKRQIQQKKREFKEAKDQVAAIFKKLSATRGCMISTGSVRVGSVKDVDFLAEQKERHGLYCDIIVSDFALLARAKEKKLRWRMET